jgi:3-deoxy-D-manno-octulosonate 8-phosphate phosphatase (KDO 8-P phosphatase)
MPLLEKFAQISTFVFDVDGVMTNGSLLITPDGEYLRTMNVKDGYALQLAVKKGYRIIVISGATSIPVVKRMEYLGIKEIFMGIKNKKELLTKQLKPEELKKTLFMGDDLPDLELMPEVLLSCCPADAAVEIIAAAAYISPFGGGKGCVRDVIEKVMKQQGSWRPEDEIAAI